MNTSLIEVRSLTKVFHSTDGAAIHALAEIDFKIQEGEFISVVGPSGCGKTTLLRILAGLISRSGGEVNLDGNPVNAPSRDVGIVFQAPILLPWRTVLDNIMLPVEILKLDKAAYRLRAHELIEMVGLREFADKLPQELSGGMQQRAAIARALVHNPRILLMDEPFGALDALTREQMNMELQRIWAESGKTVFLITHSIPEAIFLADRVMVMSSRPGKVDRTIEVDIARPRSIESMSTPRFGEVASQIRRLFEQRGYID